MTAHQWEHEKRTQATFLKPASRVCKHCRARQELLLDFTWGRVTSRRWLPLVGRCKPKKKGRR